MTDLQFSALTRVAGIGHDTRIYAALRAMYLHGKTLAEASREADVRPPSVISARNRMTSVSSTLPGRILLLRQAAGEVV